MLILLIMCIGVFIGNRFFPLKLKRGNEYLQLICTLLLIFSMGVNLGKKENFIHELTSLGGQSFLFFIIPTVFSILFVYTLTKHFMDAKNTKQHTKEQAEEE